ncbi:MAG: T9SS type A sorting domain-containing protein [Candidatus Eisenbacteria bacterium]
MPRLAPIHALSAAILLNLLAASAHATWPHLPGTGAVPVCTAANQQEGVIAVSDGAGGVIMAWEDARSGLLNSSDIVAQRLDAHGVPLWTANGVIVCNANSLQQFPQMASDGAGGAIIVWEDSRNGASDIFAQRINASGVPQWAPNGVVVCSAGGIQQFPKIVADGVGGAFTCWSDVRSGISLDVFGARLNSAGASVWGANGIPICTAVGSQTPTDILADGVGGAIVAWEDSRSGVDYDIYLQHIASGTTQWALDGVAACAVAGNQIQPKLGTDHLGGAIVVWADQRSGTYDIYARRVEPDGTMQWTPDGIEVCIAAGAQLAPALVSDGDGGAIIAWADLRSVTSYDVYCQHVSPGGATTWLADGVPLTETTGNQDRVSIVSDGSGGAIVTWEDLRGVVNRDLYAQRVSALGTPMWALNGNAVCTATNRQWFPSMVTDGAGGAIIAWSDLRNNGFTDIYAQRVERYGQLGEPAPVIASVSDVPNDQGGVVKVSWNASYRDADPTYGVVEYRLFRSVPTASSAVARASRSVVWDSDEAVRTGAWLAQVQAGNTFFWEYVGTSFAEGLPGYSRVTSTTSDSIASGFPYTTFMVEARAGTAVSAPRWFSEPDSGYSVDDLAPLAPAPFTGVYSVPATSLHWGANHEPDLAGYRLYRGLSLGFVPSEANVLVAQADTGYVDPAGSPYVYKLSAVDVHGNESPYVTWVPAGTLDATPGGMSLALAPPSPNPARGRTLLDFTLSKSEHVRLSVFDAAGREVRVLADELAAPGTHHLEFALEDRAGRPLRSGLYWVRLQTARRTLTRRLIAFQ